MKRLFGRFFLLIIITALAFPASAQFMVGTGRKVINPENHPMWMGGYASRTKPASGINHDIWAKALAIKDDRQNRVLIITVDAHKISREITADVTKRIMEKHSLNRSDIIINISHTHCGPMIWPNADMLEFSIPDQQAVFIYSRQLTNDIVEAADMALSAMEPMTLASGHGSATFGKNRRDPDLTYRPSDSDVPVLKFTSSDGKVKAILFGYACHNTTLPGEFLEINGDYAGFAQSDLEDAFPGATALFVQGCAGDINPSPRGTLENAIENGKALAGAVETVLNGELEAVNPPIKTTYTEIDLDFKPFDLGQYRKDILSKDKYVQRRARLMLLAYNNDFDMSKFSYPIQAVRFGKDLTMLALGGEAVVDYAIMTRKNYPGENLFIAGYCNEVICYIPTKRILAEGGYEPEGSMVYYVLPGPFDSNIEDKLMGGIKLVLKKLGVKSN